jgi:hypothetical protein
MKLAVIVMEAKQQRSDHGLTLVVAEAANDAVGAAIILDLLHAAAIVGPVRQVAPLGDDAIERRADPGEPSARLRQLGRGRRQADGS